MNYDISRCEGNGSPVCIDCLRRTEPGHVRYQSYIAPVAEYATCENKLEMKLK